MLIIKLVKALAVLLIAKNAASVYYDNTSLLLAYNEDLFESDSPHHFLITDTLPVSTICDFSCYPKNAAIDEDTCNINCFTQEEPDKLVTVGWFSFFKNGTNTVCHNVYNKIATLWQENDSPDNLHLTSKDATVISTELKKCRMD